MTVLIIHIFFYSSSSPGATSSSSNQGENSERPQPCDGVTSASHYNTKTNKLYKSDSSPGCYSHENKCSVQSVHTNVSKSPSGAYSRPESAVPSNVNLKRHKRRLSPYQHSGDDNQGRKFPQNIPESSSSSSNVKSKVSWV